MNRRRFLFGLSCMLALALALGTAKKAASLGSPDFKVFYTAARHVFTDPENIYRISPDRFLYPPSTAVLLTPFAFTENFSLHQWLWHTFLAGIFVALSSTGAGALAAMFLLLRYLAITFSYGQINLVVIALLALTGAAVRRGSLRGSGILWVSAISLKVYPAVLAPFFLPAERRRAWSGALLFGLFLLLLPFVCFGLEVGSQLYADFFEALKAKGLPTHSHNQSISALFLRLGTTQEFYLHAVGPAWWGIVNAPVSLLRILALSLGAFLAAVSWKRAWQKGPDAALSAASFSLLFLSHIVWKDYLLFLYFPLKEGFALWSRKKSYWVAGLFLALITFSSPDFINTALTPLNLKSFATWLYVQPDALGHAVSTRLDAACIHLWAAVIVWVAWWKK